MSATAFIMMFLANNKDHQQVMSFVKEMAPSAATYVTLLTRYERHRNLSLRDAVTWS